MQRIGILIVAFTVAGGGIARADDKSAAAEALFVKAKKLEKDGKTAEACEAYAKSQALDPQFGTQYNLALCDVVIGKLASAWTIFRELAQRDTNGKRKADSDKRARELDDRITKLLITMSGSVPGAKVTRDGVDVSDLVGVEDPVDAGTYHVTASAPGYQAWASDVAVSGEGAVITVQIPSLLKMGDVVQKRPSPQGGPVGLRTTALPPAKHSGSGRKLIGLGVTGAGVVAAGIGLYFGTVASSKWSDAKDACPENICANQADLARGHQLIKDARSAGTLSTILVAAGVAVAAVGVVVWVTAPKGEHRDETTLRVIPAGAGLALAGAFW